MISRIPEVRDYTPHCSMCACFPKSFVSIGFLYENTVHDYITWFTMRRVLLYLGCWIGALLAWWLLCYFAVF